MPELRKVFRNGLLWRGVMIVALFVMLQVLLLDQRTKLLDQEADFGHAILDNAWSISELLVETKNLAVQLSAHASDRSDVDQVRLGFDILWSRINALGFAERIRMEGLETLKADYLDTLRRHEPAVFADTPIPDAQITSFVEELEDLSRRTRQLWSAEFNQNRRAFLGRVSGEISGTARDIDALMAFVSLAGLAYLGVELLMSNRALKREQALAREARSASEMKSCFVANMSHEVRTPLSGVLGAADLLRGTALDPDQRQLVDTLATSAEHLLGVVNQVLDMSKIEAGKVEIEDGVVDLAATGDIVVSMFRRAAEAKGLAIELAVDPSLAPHVRGDPLRIRQILANLLSNAVKFTEAGRVALDIAGGPGDPGSLILRVRDTGIGIAPDAQSRIFEAFSQSDISDTRKFGGTGLGLTISRRLTELLGGSISLESRPGEGTEVTVRLPYRPVTRPLPRRAAREAADGAGRSGVSVLIADDNATNRMLLSRMLGAAASGIREAADGAEALRIWREGGIDIILMDVQMPVMSGTEAAARIRAEERAEGRAPVAIYSISANAMPHQIAAYSGAGMDGHLSKPFRRAELVEILQRQAHRPPATIAAE